MAVILKCTACGQKMRVAQYFSGSVVTCVSCSRELDVPHCVYDDGAAPTTEAALDEGELLRDLSGRRCYAANIVDNRDRSRTPEVVGAPDVGSPRWLMMILLVVGALVAILYVWSTLQDPSVTASIAAGG